MAISTYSELLTAAANWLARSDLTSRIPEFVTLAQARINRQVRVQAMETKNAAFSITGEYVNTPTDFLEAQHFYITSSSVRHSMEATDAAGMTGWTSTGRPRYFAVVGSQFRFSPIPDQTYTATLIYYAKPATLVVTSAETNSLFPTNVDLYLYATLLEAAPFIQDDARVGLWKQAYDDALFNLNRQAKDTRYGGAILMTRPG